MAQAIASIGDKTPQWIFFLISVAALVFALLAWNSASRMENDVQAIRSALEGQASNAQSALIRSLEDARELAGTAAEAAERADQAERSAKLSEVMARQVFVELNRLGYPIKTSAEEHSVAPAEAHQ